MADLPTRNPIPPTTYTFFTAPTSSTLSRPITAQHTFQTQPPAATFIPPLSIPQPQPSSTTGIVIDTPSTSPAPALGPPPPPPPPLSPKERPKFSGPNIAGISLAAAIFFFLAGFLLLFCLRERRLKRKRLSSVTSIPANYPLNLTGGGPDWRRVNWPEDRKRKRGAGALDELEDGGSDGIREITDAPLWSPTLLGPQIGAVRPPTPVKLRAPHNSLSGPSYPGPPGDEKQRENEAMRGMIKESMALAEKPLIRKPSDGARSMRGSMRVISEGQSREASRSREGKLSRDNSKEKKKEGYIAGEDYRDLESEKAAFRRREESRSRREKEREERERRELARIHEDVVSEEARAREEAQSRPSIESRPSLEAARLRSRFQSLLNQEIPHPIQPPVPTFAPPPRSISEPTTAELVARQQAQHPLIGYGYQPTQPFARPPPPRPKTPRTPVTPSIRLGSPAEMAERPAKPRSNVSWADSVGWAGPRVTWDAKKQELVPQESPLRQEPSPIAQKDQSPASYFPSTAKESSPLKLFPSPMKPRRQGSKDSISASPLKSRPSLESPLRRQPEMRDMSSGPSWMAEPLTRKPSREAIEMKDMSPAVGKKKMEGMEGMEVQEGLESGNQKSWWRDSIPLAQAGAAQRRSTSAPTGMVGRPGTSWFNFEDSP